MRAILNIPYADRNPAVNNLNIYLPDEGESFPVFLYFHGYALVHINNSLGEDPFVVYLTEHGIAVVAANYSLYPSSKGCPNVKYPTFLEDAAGAVAWVKAHISEYCKMDSLIVGGSSTGAYLSAMLCFDRKWLGAHGIVPTDIDGFIHDSPQLTTHYSILKEKGLANNRVMIDESAPLYYVGTEKEYPSMLFINAEHDSHTRLSQTKLMVTALKNLGHTAPKIQSVVLEGTHCSYVNEPNTVFGEVLRRFIQSEK